MRPRLQAPLCAALCLGFGIVSGSALAAPAAFKIQYRLKPGEQFRYDVVAFLNGHVPPFEASGPPVHVRIHLTYRGTVKSVTKDGAEVAFDVDTAELFLLEKEPAPGDKIDPSSETPLPLAPSQIQHALNVTATLQPDGSISKITGGPAMGSIDFGFDLRKLFLLTMPMTFPSGPIHANEPWQFNDGILGHNPGKTMYQGRVSALKSLGGAYTVTAVEKAQSNVDEMRDKDNHATTDSAQSTFNVTGTVSCNGTLDYTASGSSAHLTGRLKTGTLLLTADLLKKRLKPDPQNPSAVMEEHIDVHGRLLVTIAKEAPATHTASAAKSSGTHE
jgi:hypothetical protein